MYYLKLTLCFLMFTGLIACQQKEKTPQSTAQRYEVPSLLDRPERLRMGKEWDEVQSSYVANRNRLWNNASLLEPKLALSALFIGEARVTGEHGHYYPSALQLLEDIIDSKPSDQDILFRALTAKAGVLLSLHQFDEALATGLQAVQINPLNAQIHGVLVDAYVELGDYEQAVKMADKMIAIKPDIRSYSRVSYLREIHGEVEGAIEAMILAVKAGFPALEETAWAQLTLGELYQQYDYEKEAELLYQQILNERTDYPFAIAALADLEMQRQNWEKAEQLLEDAIAIIPEVGFNIQLVKLYQATNRQEKVQPMLDQIFEMLQEDTDSGHNMDMEYAYLYSEVVHDDEKALEYAQKEYDKRPNNIDVNRLMAQIHQQLQQYEAVEKYLTVASRTNSKHPELLALKAQISLK